MDWSEVELGVVDLSDSPVFPSDKWGGCLDWRYPGSISGLLNSWLFCLLDNNYNYIGFSTLFWVILVFVYNYILILFVNSWYVCFEAYGIV